MTEILFDYWNLERVSQVNFERDPSEIYIVFVNSCKVLLSMLSTFDN